MMVLMVGLVLLAVINEFGGLTEACSGNGYYLNSGDTCWSTAQKCGISLETLYYHNGLTAGGSGCNNLQPGHFLCCTYWRSLDTLE